MNEELRNWLTVNEAAARIGESLKTVRRLVRAGKLKAFKHGKTLPLRFRQVDVDRYLESASAGPCPLPSQEGAKV